MLGNLELTAKPLPWAQNAFRFKEPVVEAPIRQSNRLKLFCVPAANNFGLHEGSECACLVMTLCKLHTLVGHSDSMER